MKARLGKRVLSALLLFGMLLTLLPTMAFATGGDAGGVTLLSENGSLELSKTATLEADGTYTIQLEAFSTGENMTLTSQTPTDIVLVLDVSGSMEEDFTYVSGQEWTSVRDDFGTPDGPTDVYHHCPDGSYSPVEWTEWGGWWATGRHRYVCTNCHASRKWDTPTRFEHIPGEGDDDHWNLWRYTDIETTEEKMTALKDAVNSFLSGVQETNAVISNPSEQHRVAIVKFASEDVNYDIGNDMYREGWNEYNYTQTVAGMTTVTSDTLGGLTGAVNELQPGGATASDKGLDLASGILANTEPGRNKVVILFTDGEPTYGSSFSAIVANNAVEEAKELKDVGTTVYTIGLFTGADPSDTSDRSNAYMNGVSSNYPNATSYTQLGSRVAEGEYYKTVTGTNSLQDIFEEIEQDITTTDVTLDANAQLRDYLNSGFVLTDESEVTVQTDEYSGRDSGGNRVFAGNPQTYTAAVKDTENNTVTVSGFNFSKEYLVDGDTPDESDFTAAVEGRKLIVTITKVEATDDAVTNDLVSTNTASSGIYENADASVPVAAFEQPQTQLSSKAYVLDYAKKVTVTDLPNTIVNVDSTGMHEFDTSSPSMAPETNYGSTTVNANNGSFTYTPTTTNWDGYDQFYVFGQWSATPEGVTTGNNTWTKVSVIPANNVYYEDDFVTTDTGTVGIVYSSDGWTTVTDGTTGNTGEVDGSNDPNDAADGNHGWIESKDNDTAYSDGSAHQGTTGATATFTFTGTGVDIYSRTDSTTGVVVARLTSIGEDGTRTPLKSLVMDNQSLSDDGTGYYQIPTLFFGELEHGTYEVQIIVRAAGERSTYYLDGIRVYNPLSSTQEDNEDVQEAYGDEVDATFESVRDILIDASDYYTEDEEGNRVVNEDAVFEGAVFIDYNAINEAEGDSSNVVGTYVDYGPKNEVYLAKDQAIYLNVGAGFSGKVAIGLKGPEGEATASVTNGDDENARAIPVKGASDQYYTITPDSEGNIEIRNTGDNLLSVTKLKTSGGTEAELSVEPEIMMAYVASFNSLPVVDDVPEIEEPEETVPEEPAEDETVAEEPEQGEVVIENPEEPAEEEPVEPVSNSWVGKLFSAIRNLFRF